MSPPILVLLMIGSVLIAICPIVIYQMSSVDCSVIKEKSIEYFNDCNETSGKEYGAAYVSLGNGFAFIIAGVIAHTKYEKRNIRKPIDLAAFSKDCLANTSQKEFTK